MTLYAYAGRDMSGREIRGVIDAEDERAVRDLMRRRSVLLGQPGGQTCVGRDLHVVAFDLYLHPNPRIGAVVHLVIHESRMAVHELVPCGSRYENPGVNPPWPSPKNPETVKLHEKISGHQPTASVNPSPLKSPTVHRVMSASCHARATLCISL